MYKSLLLLCATKVLTSSCDKGEKQSCNFKGQINFINQDPQGITYTIFINDSLFAQIGSNKSALYEFDTGRYNIRFDGFNGTLRDNQHYIGDCEIHYITLP